MNSECHCASFDSKPYFLSEIFICKVNLFYFLTLCCKFYRVVTSIVRLSEFQTKFCKRKCSLSVKSLGITNRLNFAF